MRDVVWLGPCPAEEDAVQSTDPDFHAKNRDECLLFIKALKQKFGVPPAGAVFKMKREDHDFGSYREVCIEVDGDNQAAMDWAYMVEDKAPGKWSDYGFEPPARQQGIAR